MHQVQHVHSHSKTKRVFEVAVSGMQRTSRTICSPATHRAEEQSLEWTAIYKEYVALVEQQVPDDYRLNPETLTLV